MTREDAIARLEMMFQECSFPQKRCKGDCCTCSKAIEALSKVDNAENPKCDLISRADAIRVVEIMGFETLVKAISALPSAEVTVAKIQIDDIDKAKTSSQLLDDLAVDMVNAMGKRIVEVVRCKDCRYAHECHKSVQYTRNEPRTVTIGYSPIEFCSHGERKGGAE